MHGTVGGKPHCASKRRCGVRSLSDLLGLLSLTPYVIMLATLGCIDENLEPGTDGELSSQGKVWRVCMDNAIRKLRLIPHWIKSKFIPKAALVSMLLVAGAALLPAGPREPAEGAAEAEQPPVAKSFQQYLEKSVVSRKDVDDFLAGKTWGQFDPELGYVLGNSLNPWGIDHSSAIETVQANGSRTSFLYADKKARINAYGDSYTECEQVSDGETWEEYLAGHLGEPVRNFGVGGYGVYQAYRRMLREEKTDHSAKYLILMICCDDSIRSLYRMRWAAIYPWFREEAESIHMFHGNAWDYMEMDLETGKFVERKSLLSTPESLYHMTEPRWMADHLKDDLPLQLEAYRRGFSRDLDRERITKLAARLGFPIDWNLESTTASVNSKWSDTPETPMQFQAGELLNRYGQRATIFVLDQARDFAKKNGKKLLVVLNGTVDLDRLKKEGKREDQEVLDYLKNEKFDYVDLNAVFFRDFQKSSLSAEDFMNTYLVNEAHLNPMGNHFIAYAMKDKIVQWLDPKPVPYQQPEAQSVSFKGYLHGGVYH